MITENRATTIADRDPCPLPEVPGRTSLILQLEAGSAVSQGETRVVLLVGDLLLLDPGTPAEVTPIGASCQLRVLLPDSTVRLTGGCRIAGASRLGAALRSLVLLMHAAAGAMDPRESHAFAAALLDLLEAVPAEGRPADAMPGPEGQRLSRLKQSIDQSLSDPALCPARIAARHGLSVRHLHRLFQQAGLSFSAYVRCRRLVQARIDLLDPTLATLPVTEIALRWGFSDSAHFSRSFRAAFGCTPRSLRSRATAPVGPPPLRGFRWSPSSGQSPDGSDE